MSHESQPQQQLDSRSSSSSDLSPSCDICYNFDSHSPYTRERRRPGYERRPYGEYRYEVEYGFVHEKATQGCLSCRALVDALESQGLRDLSYERIWLCGQDGQSMFVEPRNTMLFTPIEIYTRQGNPSPWPAIGPAGHVQEDPFQDSCIAQYKSWISECDINHGVCNTKSERQLPSRILDIGFENMAQDPRLIVTEGRCENYVALSYTWGGKPSFTTTKATLQNRLQGITLDLMPKTFQDAIKITRLLNIRYLWIDALCIVQDDPKDWEREAAQMASIFGNSYLTISATSAKNVDTGFQKPRPTAKENKYRTKDGREFSVYTRPFLKTKILRKSSDSFDVEAYPVLGRGWCLQERLLSRRVLHFTNEEVLWDCHSVSQCECGSYGNDGRRSIMGQFHHAVQEMKKVAIESRGASNQNEYCAAVVPHLNEIWGTIMEAYTRTDLTFSSDLLPALSGLANRLQDAGAGSYMAGLWDMDLARQLTWHSGWLNRNEKQNTEYIAPSWSFLKRPGPVHYTNTWLDVQHVRILAASCTPRGEDVTGAVSDGWIKLYGPLLELQITDIKVVIAFTDAVCNTRGGRSVKVRWDPDSVDDAWSVKKGDFVYILRMFSIAGAVECIPPDTPKVTVCLALRRDPSIPNVFYRFGRSLAMNNYWDEAEMKTIVLK